MCAYETLDTLGYGLVQKHPVDVRHWERGVETIIAMAIYTLFMLIFHLNHKGSWVS